MNPEIVFVVVFVLILIVILIAVTHSNSEYDKEYAQRKANFEKKASLAKAAPPCRVYFIDMESRKRKTELFEAYVLTGLHINHVDFPKTVAEKYIKNSFKDGYLTDEKGKHYPSCNIKQVWVSEEIQDDNVE